MPVRKYIVNFFDQRGRCYFKDTAIHVDISKYQTLIDFTKTPLSNESCGLFLSYDEMERFDVMGNIFKITYVSGQTITICQC